MLNILKINVNTCIMIYLKMALKIFPFKGFILRSKLRKFLKGARGITRFDNCELERFIKALIIKNLNMIKEDALLNVGEVRIIELSFKI